MRIGHTQLNHGRVRAHAEARTDASSRNAAGGGAPRAGAARPLSRAWKRRKRRLRHGLHLLGHAPAASRCHQAHPHHQPLRSRQPQRLYGRGGPVGGAYGVPARASQHRDRLRLRDRRPLRLPRDGVRRRPHGRRAAAARRGRNPHPPGGRAHPLVRRGRPRVRPRAS